MVVLGSIHSGGHRAGSGNGVGHQQVDDVGNGTQCKSGACVIEHLEMRKHRMLLKQQAVWIGFHPRDQHWVRLEE